MNEIVTSTPFDLGAAAAEPVVEASAVVEAVIRDTTDVKGVVAVSTVDLCRREDIAIQGVVVGPTFHQGLSRRRQIVRTLVAMQPVTTATRKIIVP